MGIDVQFDEGVDTGYSVLKVTQDEQTNVVGLDGNYYDQKPLSTYGRDVPDLLVDLTTMKIVYMDKGKEAELQKVLNGLLTSGVCDEVESKQAGLVSLFSMFVREYTLEHTTSPEVDDAFVGLVSGLTDLEYTQRAYNQKRNELKKYHQRHTYYTKVVALDALDISEHQELVDTYIQLREKIYSDKKPILKDRELDTYDEGLMGEQQHVTRTIQDLKQTIHKIHNDYKKYYENTYALEKNHLSKTIERRLLGSQKRLEKKYGKELIEWSGVLKSTQEELEIYESRHVDIGLEIEEGKEQLELMHNKILNNSGLFHEMGREIYENDTRISVLKNDEILTSHTMRINNLKERYADEIVPFLTLKGLDNQIHDIQKRLKMHKKEMRRLEFDYALCEQTEYKNKKQKHARLQSITNQMSLLDQEKTDLTRVLYQEKRSIYNDQGKEVIVQGIVGEKKAYLTQHTSTLGVGQYRYEKSIHQELSALYVEKKTTTSVSLVEDILTQIAEKKGEKKKHDKDFSDRKKFLLSEQERCSLEIDTIYAEIDALHQNNHGLIKRIYTNLKSLQQPSIQNNIQNIPVTIQYIEKNIPILERALTELEGTLDQKDESFRLAQDGYLRLLEGLEYQKEKIQKEIDGCEWEMRVIQSQVDAALSKKSDLQSQKSILKKIVSKKKRTVLGPVPKAGDTSSKQAQRYKKRKKKKGVNEELGGYVVYDTTMDGDQMITNEQYAEQIEINEGIHPEIQSILQMKDEGNKQRKQLKNTIHNLQGELDQLAGVIEQCQRQYADLGISKLYTKKYR